MYFGWGIISFRARIVVIRLQHNTISLFVKLIKFYLLTKNTPLKRNVDTHRRRSSVNFGGRHFCPKIYVWKINKMPEFYMIFAWKKYIKMPGFLWYFITFVRKIDKINKILELHICPKNARILPDNCPKNMFPLWGGGCVATAGCILLIIFIHRTFL